MSKCCSWHHPFSTHFPTICICLPRFLGNRSSPPPALEPAGSAEVCSQTVDGNQSASSPAATNALLWESVLPTGFECHVTFTPPPSLGFIWRWFILSTQERHSRSRALLSFCILELRPALCRVTLKRSSFKGFILVFSPCRRVSLSVSWTISWTSGLILIKLLESNLCVGLCLQPIDVQSIQDGHRS